MGEDVTRQGSGRGTGRARVQVVAHRGARRVAPENTLAAFAAARRLGADGVELDVHRSADDALVVHHDAGAPGFGVLAEHPLAEIRAALPTVPLLGEVLDACAGMLVNVEIKNSPGDADRDPSLRAADLVVELLVARDRDRVPDRVPDRVLLSSFDLATIDRVRVLDAGVPTGYLTFGVDPFAALELAHANGHGAVHPDAWSLSAVAARLVARADELGVAVNTWTVNEPDVIRALAESGVSVLITDVPDVALRELGREPAPPG